MSVTPPIPRPRVVCPECGLETGNLGRHRQARHSMPTGPVIAEVREVGSGGTLAQRAVDTVGVLAGLIRELASENAMLRKVADNMRKAIRELEEQP